jgi:glutaredoxin
MTEPTYQQGVTSVHVAGWSGCGFFKRAKGQAANLREGIAVEIVELATRDEYQTWLADNGAAKGSASHTSSPFVWQNDGDFIGGCDEFIAWSKKSGITNGNATPHESNISKQGGVARAVAGGFVCLLALAGALLLALVDPTVHFAWRLTMLPLWIVGCAVWMQTACGT